MKMFKFSLPMVAGVMCAVSSAVHATGSDVSVSIGTIQPGQEAVITYEVTINSPLSPSVTQISNQAKLIGTGFTSPKLTDDPEATAAGSNAAGNGVSIVSG